MLTIKITGDRGEGSTTLAVAIAHALRDLGSYTVQYQGMNEACTKIIQKQIDGPPIPPGALDNRVVAIHDLGAAK